MRVLIADDSITVARALTGILEGLGHEVIGHAKNGVDAVRLHGELHPDVVLLDIVMPHMDGLTALRTLKHNDNGVRAVVISSAGGVGANVQEALKLGAKAVVSKPFDAESIGHALQKCGAGAS